MQLNKILLRKWINYDDRINLVLSSGKHLQSKRKSLIFFNCHISVTATAVLLEGFYPIQLAWREVVISNRIWQNHHFLQMLRDYEGFFPQKARHKWARGFLLQMHVATAIANHRRVPVEQQSFINQSLMRRSNFWRNAPFIQNSIKNLVKDFSHWETYP